MRTDFERALARKLNLVFADDDPVWCDARRILITGGIRAGKSTRGAFKAFKESLNPRCKLIWLVGPDYVHAQEEFRMIYEWAQQFNLVERVSMPQDGVRRLLLRTGCQIETRSAKHPERLASVAPDGIVLCEPGQMPSEVYEIVLGRLTQRRGWLFMCGTLEDGLAHRRWAWYEDLAVSWAGNGSDAPERSFSLPTWSNRVIYPDGEDDAELQSIKASVSDYQWQRTYGGVPLGVENPAFPLLWEMNSTEEFIIPRDARFVDGAIGVDVGRTWDHPSAIVAVSVDEYERYWVRDCWVGVRADLNELVSVVESFKANYEIWQGCVDPRETILAMMLGFAIAPGGSTGGKPTETRIHLTNGLLENRAFFFELGTNAEDVYHSMRLCARVRNAQGEVVYNRPKGDDLAQACMYAIELLRGNTIEIPPLDMGGYHQTYLPAPTHQGRI